MTQKEAIAIFKRFLLVFLLVGIPLIFILTIVAKLKSFLVIIISVLCIAGIFSLEEYLYFKNLKKKQERRKGDNK